MWRLAVLLFIGYVTATSAQDDYIADGARKPANAAELQAIVDAPPPAGASPKDLDAYFRQREAAAQQLGLNSVLLQNAQAWFDSMPEGEMRLLPRWQLWAHHKTHGDRALAMQLGEQVVAEAKGSVNSFLSRFQLARDYLDQWELVRARKLVDEGEAALAAAKARPNDPTTQFQLLRGRVDLLALRSTLAGLDGKFSEAESQAQAALGPAREAVALVPKLDARRQEIAYGVYTDAANALRKAYLTLGKTYQAELLLRETIDFLRKEDRLARRYPGLMRHAAQIRLAQGRFADARHMAEASLKGFQDSGEAVISAQTVWSRLTRLYALLGAEAWPEAHDEARRLESDTASIPALRKLLENSPRGLAKLKGGDAEGALRHFNAAVKFNLERYGPGHFFTAQAQGLQGAAQLQQARARRNAAEERAALTTLRRAEEDMAQLRGISSGSIDNGMRAVYRRIILEAYLAALLPAMQAGDAEAIAEGFRTADTLRGASVQQAVVDAALRSATAVPGLGELIRRLQDGQREIAGLYDYIARQLGEPPERRNAQVVAKMRARLQEVESERERLLQQIRQQFPEFDQLSRPQAPLPAEVARRLGPREAMLALLSASDRIYLWLVTPDGVRFAVRDIDASGIESLVRRLRQTLDVAAMETPTPVDAAAAHALYSHLVQPLHEATKGRDQLVIAAGGLLGGLPFPALLTGPGNMPPEKAPWLVREFAVAAIPSVSAWLALRKLPPPGGARVALAAFGDPDFGGRPTLATATMRGTRNLTLARSDSGAVAAEAGLGAAAVRYQSIPPLPETRTELLAIARTLGADGRRDVFLGRDASKPMVLKLNGARQLNNRQVVVFATHGLVPGDLPGLEQPALALAFAGSTPDDALFTLEDVLGLQLDADWVVLSACNTAAADGRSGEALSGLGRGFFYAGARALLVTHWAVESESAMQLTTTTFERFATDPRMPRGEALRQAQLTLLRNPATAHPTYWAPFALVGDGAR